MNTFKLLFSALLFIFISNNLFSQIDLSEPDRIHCGTAVINNQRLAENPLLQDIADEQNRVAAEYEKTHDASKSGVITYTIPVVYHIIHNNGPENVSKATIEASIQNLNEDYQKMNADISQVVAAFAGIAADCEIQFRLAHKDPNGNCTEGITRTVSTQTYSAGENVKSLINWNSNGTQKYLQIWVVQTLTSGAGGYSYYPGYAPSGSKEGIVIRSAQLTNSVTHEVGHYLNLPHCWGNSNDPGLASNCSGDDGVSDTPNTIGNTTCNTSAVSCSSLDNVQNYMEYSFCERMFTNGQKSRMHSALNSTAGTRNNLWKAVNLNATGTNDPYAPVTCAPVALFSYDKEYICEGASVTFTDDSYNAVPTAWNWTFTGGTPSSSSLSSPTITYNTSGVYSVTHQPSTAAGSGTITKNSIITVSSIVADYVGPIIDGFESTTVFNNDWMINADPVTGQSWTNTTTAAATGSRSVRVRNYSTNNTGEVDELVSSSFDISTATVKTMTFKQAFAKKATGNSDKLLVYYSTDCGASWILKLPLTTGNLTTAPDHSNEFMPTATEWVERTVSLSSIGTSTNVRFKFEFTSGGGNNIYIDDINIGGYSVGINDPLNNIGSFSVYPNPTSSSAQIAFNLTKDVNVLKVKVRNAVGQEVTNVVNGQSFNAGKYTLNIDKERKLSSGIYFIEFNADSNVKVQKLVVQ